ncbi:hypothetical protein C8R46DRAFT_1307816 [Mycena filopes]|nr:hypothetical protein C8R46DRAFT_1307816 [Mycena filopes]
MSPRRSADSSGFKVSINSGIAEGVLKGVSHFGTASALLRSTSIISPSTVDTAADFAARGMVRPSDDLWVTLGLRPSNDCFSDGATDTANRTSPRGFGIAADTAADFAARGMMRPSDDLWVTLGLRPSNDCFSDGATDTANRTSPRGFGIAADTAADFAARGMMRPSDDLWVTLGLRPSNDCFSDGATDTANRTSPRGFGIATDTAADFAARGMMRPSDDLWVTLGLRLSNDCFSDGAPDTANRTSPRGFGAQRTATENLTETIIPPATPSSRTPNTMRRLCLRSSCLNLRMPIDLPLGPTKFESVQAALASIQQQKTQASRLELRWANYIFGEGKCMVCGGTAPSTAPFAFLLQLRCCSDVASIKDLVDQFNLAVRIQDAWNKRYSLEVQNIRRQNIDLLEKIAAANRCKLHHLLDSPLLLRVFTAFNRDLTLMDMAELKTAKTSTSSQPPSRSTPTGLSCFMCPTTSQRRYTKQSLFEHTAAV